MVRVTGGTQGLYLLIGLFSILMSMSFPAFAEKRVALLIGNESYTSAIGQLANPHNDVALLEQALKGLGFEVVTVRDAGLGVLHQAINAYARRLEAAGPDAIGFFYYSGHGASDGSTNYLIPVDVKTTETGALWDESLRLTEITSKLKKEAGNATHFVVFDACRNTLRLTQSGSRAVVQSKGFVPVAQENGMLIAYATAEGELASDVGSGAGPYAKVLAEEIVKPGIEAVVMFRAVQLRVRAAIHQEPYVGFSALGNVYLAGKAEQVAAATAAPPTQARLSEAAEAWDRTKDTTNITVLEAFMARFKDTFLAELARARIEELKKQKGVKPDQVAIATPPSQPPTGSPAHARKAILYCSKQAPGSIVLKNIWEIDFDRSTIRELESAASTKPSPEMPAEISLQWIKWHYPRGRDEIDRFTGEYHSYLYDAGSQGRGDLDLSRWSGSCTMSDGPTVR